MKHVWIYFQGNLTISEVGGAGAGDKVRRDIGLCRGPGFMLSRVPHYWHRYCISSYTISGKVALQHHLLVDSAFN